MEANMTEKKNTCKLQYKETELTFSGDFDSGNLNWAGINHETDVITTVTQEIQLLFGKDKDIKGNAKCWFHFSISGNYTYLPLKLHLLKTNSLNMVVKFP